MLSFKELNFLFSEVILFEDEKMKEGAPNIFHSMEQLSFNPRHSLLLES
jgi:hypothetical protein